MSKQNTVLRTKIFGEKNNKTVVFIHGWGIHSGVMDNMADKLSQDLKVIMIDLPGYGINKDIEFPEDISDLLEMLRDTVNASAYWLGWSFGTTIAIKMASQYPEMIEGLISLAGTPCFVNSFDMNSPCWRNGIDRELAEEFVEQLNADPAKCLKTFEAQIASLELSPRDVLKRIRNAQKNNQPEELALKRTISVLHGSDLRVELSEINKPALWLFGKNDSFIKPIPSKSLRTGHSDTRTAILLGAGHLPFITAEDDVVHLVRKFTGVYE